MDIKSDIIGVVFCVDSKTKQDRSAIVYSNKTGKITEEALNFAQNRNVYLDITRAKGILFEFAIEEFDYETLYQTKISGLYSKAMVLGTSLKMRLENVQNIQDIKQR